MEFISLSNVPKADVVSESDPYIRAKLVRLSKDSNGNVRRHPISKSVQTLGKIDSPSPTFNGYRNLRSERPLKPDDVLRVKVYDQDATADELIGSAHIPLSEILPTPTTFKVEGKTQAFRDMEPNFSITLRRLFVERQPDGSLKPLKPPQRKGFFVVRHGESKWNVAQANNDLKGMAAYDHGLTSVGIDQARTLNQRWKMWLEENRTQVEKYRSCIGTSGSNNNSNSNKADSENESKAVVTSDLLRRVTSAPPPSSKSSKVQKQQEKDEAEQSFANDSETSDEEDAMGRKTRKPAVPRIDAAYGGLHNTASSSQAVSSSGGSSSTTTSVPESVNGRNGGDGNGNGNGGGNDNTDAEETASPKGPRIRSSSMAGPNEKEDKGVLGDVPDTLVSASMFGSTGSPSAVTGGASTTAESDAGLCVSTSGPASLQVNVSELPLQSPTASSAGGFLSPTFALSPTPTSPTPTTKVHKLEELDETPYMLKFLTADAAYASPLTRATQTALFALQGHPMFNSNSNTKLRLMSTIREIRNVGGLDTIGDAEGEQIMRRVEEEMLAELTKGQVTTIEEADSKLVESKDDALCAIITDIKRVINQTPVDIGDAYDKWWTSSFDSKANVEERVQDMLNFVRYSDAVTPIFVGHSLFFKFLYSNRIASKFPHKLYAAVMKKHRLNNGALMYIEVDFEPSSPVVVDACLLAGSSFHPKH